MPAVRRSLLLLLLITSSAFAQPGGPGGPRFSGRRGLASELMWLASMSEVRDELEVGPEQGELLDALAADLRDQRRTVFRRGFDAQPDSGDRDAQEVRQQLASLDKQSETLLAIILEPEQFQRLQQIRVQWEGIRALDREEFLADLEVSEEQKEQIRQILETALEAFQANRRRPRDADDDQQMNWEEIESQIRGVLTEAQQEKWEDMKGDPFDFPQPRRRFSRRGFPRRD